MRLNRAGFTLIELLVAMMISGILATVMFQLMSGQGRFIEIQSAREEVQQNSRAALDLIGNDLRTIPGGGAIVRAHDDSITVRTARIWGVVCAAGGNTVDLLLPAINQASYSANPGTGVVVNVGTPEAPAYTNAVVVSSIGNAATTCNGNPVPANSERRTVTVPSLPQNAGNPPVAGNVAYIYDQVTYSAGTSTTVPGRWIRRRQGDGSGSVTAPMAGPIVENESGLSFRYFVGASSTPVATPVAAAVRDSITRVQIAVGTISRNGSGSARQSKADTVVITLRNRL